MTEHYSRRAQPLNEAPVTPPCVIHLHALRVSTVLIYREQSTGQILPIADELRERIPQLRVMICRQCQYGVWPIQQAWR
jgi:hypothetical protein